MPKDDCCGPDRHLELDDDNGRPLSRRLALGGLVAAAGGALAVATAGAAAAQTTSTEPEDTEPGGGPVVTGTDETIGTTVPPRRPTPTDIALLAFAQTIELAAVQLYDQALEVLTEPMRGITTVMRRHHRAYAEQIGGQLGRRAPGIANRTLVQERTPAFGARAEPAIVRAMYELEISIAASYSAVLGALRGTDGAALVASIQPVEARHAVVLGQAIGIDDEELMPVLEGDEDDVTLFTPSQYPVLA